MFTKYREGNELVTAFGSGLRKLGLNIGDHVGIFAKNCPEWHITDYSCACHALVSVPVYDSYQPQDCKFIMAHSDMKAIVLTVDKVKFVSDLVAAGELPQLKLLIQIDDLRHPSAPKVEGASYKFSEVVALGKENPLPDPPVQPEDVYTIVYTSGTTGVPKGAMISHKNACCSAILLMTRATPPPQGTQGVDLYIHIYLLL